MFFLFLVLFFFHLFPATPRPWVCEDPKTVFLKTIFASKTHMIEWNYTTMILIWILAFVVAITIHEASHAWMADRLGDPTARLMGRLSLNPLVHYDPVGTTLLLALSIMRALGAPVIPFGWAKPVEFDSYNLKNPRRDSALISFAGPASNLLVALFVSILARLNPALSIFVVPFIILNVSLAIFNLVPVHPLDGGKILVGLLPKNMHTV